MNNPKLFHTTIFQPQLHKHLYKRHSRIYMKIMSPSLENVFRFSNLTILEYASAFIVRKYKSAFVNFCLYSFRNENFQDYNLIWGTTRSFAFPYLSILERKFIYSNNDKVFNLFPENLAFSQNLTKLVLWKFLSG